MKGLKKNLNFCYKILQVKDENVTKNPFTVVNGFDSKTLYLYNVYFLRI